MRSLRMIRHALLATTLLGACAMANADPSTNQPPAPPAKPTATQAPGGSGAVVPEANQNAIIVTAQKRPELLQNVPIQVDVLTGATLQARHIKTTSEIARIVPNLTIEKTDTYSM